MKNFYKGILALGALWLTVQTNAQTVDFEDVILATDTFYVGQDGDGPNSFTSGGFTFTNNYTAAWGSWSGFGVSNVQDSIRTGYTNQFAAFPEKGANNSTNYGMATNDYAVGGAALTFPDDYVITSLQATNGTYGVRSMENGDAFGKKFGGATGDDPDYFKVTFYGYNDGVATASTVDFYLADFRFADNSQDYILKEWKNVDLTALGAIDSVIIKWESSDDSGWGPNQPSYLFVDDIVLTKVVSKIPTDPGAIAYDSTAITMWASDVVVERGYLNIADKSVESNGSNRASYGDPANAIGAVTASSTNVVSLGDSGVATLTFDREITNGVGPDFAVFENSNIPNFLELAFVEVSSDGVNFVRFPAVSRTPTQTQVSGFGTLIPDSLYNLAGKYQVGYGTPFDLEDVKDSAGLNVDAITHVRIVDAVGSVNPAFGLTDSEGNLVNDPFATPFASAGFDLAGVGVIHSAAIIAGIGEFENEKPQLYLDYANQNLHLPASANTGATLTVYAAGTGQVFINENVHAETVSLQGRLQTGTYVVQVNDTEGVETTTIFIQ